MLRSRRCAPCNTCWPLKDDFRRCPSCHRLTQPSAHATTIKLEQANKLRLHYLFDRYCDRRDARRAKDGHPSPDEIGRREARDLLELDRRAAA